jgi:hypothetical protein
MLEINKKINSGLSEAHPDIPADVLTQLLQKLIAS